MLIKGLGTGATSGKLSLRLSYKLKFIEDLIAISFLNLVELNALVVLL